MPKQAPLAERRHTIEIKSPGLGSGDGFIHTTLCRLPLHCLSTKDIELEPIHRLIREATAAYAGHRMLAHKFRFLETTGAAGDSNPCCEPLFDESMVAPPKVTAVVGGGGGGVGFGVGTAAATTTTSNGAGRLASIEERNAMTTGRALTTGRWVPPQPVGRSDGMHELFEPPSN